MSAPKGHKNLFNHYRVTKWASELERLEAKERELEAIKQHMPEIKAALHEYRERHNAASKPRKDETLLPEVDELERELKNKLLTSDQKRRRNSMHELSATKLPPHQQQAASQVQQYTQQQYFSPYQASGPLSNYNSTPYRNAYDQPLDGFNYNRRESIQEMMQYRQPYYPGDYPQNSYGQPVPNMNRRNSHYY